MNSNSIQQNNSQQNGETTSSADFTNPFCASCGKPKTFDFRLSDTQSTGGICTCGMKIKISLNKEEILSDHPLVERLTGWICPVCGRGNNPHSMSCPCKI